MYILSFFSFILNERIPHILLIDSIFYRIGIHYKVPFSMVKVLFNPVFLTSCGGISAPV